MSVLKSIAIPDISSFGDIKKIKNYLAQMDENIRYAIENIDEENITKKFIDDLTVRHLNITNGDNSIIGDPNIGFQMLKGSRKILSFDIKTGEAQFGGNIVGGSISSGNYTQDQYGNPLAGMYIDLSNGNINARGFRYTDGIFIMRSEWDMGAGEKYVLAFNDGQSVFSVFHYYMGQMDGYSQLDHEGVYCRGGDFYSYAQYKTYGITIVNEYNMEVLRVNDAYFRYMGRNVVTENMLTSLENSIKQWVTNNFEPKGA